MPLLPIPPVPQIAADPQTPAAEALNLIALPTQRWVWANAISTAATDALSFASARSASAFIGSLMAHWERLGTRLNAAEFAASPPAAARAAPVAVIRREDPEWGVPPEA